MKLKHTPRATAATAWMVCGSLLLTWFVSMAWVTHKSALSYLEYYENQSKVYNSAMHNLDLERATHSDTVDYEMWNNLAYGSNRSYDVRVYNGSLMTTSGQDDWQTATAFYSGDKNLIASSGDFLFFRYDTEECWETMDKNSATGQSGYTKVNLDLDALTVSGQFDEFYRTTERSWLSWDCFFSLDIKAMRFTGVFKGREFLADKIEYVLSNEFDRALHSREPDEHEIYEDGTEYVSYQYSYSEVIRTENVPWHTFYDSGIQNDGAIRIYATYVENSDYHSGDPLYFDETEYKNLLSLLLSKGVSDESTQISNESIFDLIVMDQSFIYDFDSPIDTPDGGRTYPAKYYITTAVRCSPVLSAMNEWKALYIVTFLLAITLAIVIIRTLRRKLIDPIDTINSAVENHRSDIPFTVGLSDWMEPAVLLQNYAAAQDTLRIRQNEITRLNTALEYAKDAEENRRQMTSNVAHELKTPLAVIHSYAEGLKEHIAEDKRDKYIDVILSETEHLDDMVLELLDLSRLEAGKVKLSLDTVSLDDLTRAVFERLDMAVQAKQLQVSFDFPPNCTLQADEARIKQVIENFVSNAVKYTPVGGAIRVTVSRQAFHTRPGTTTFAIENDSPPLSDEALSKVWETFYRTDDARSGGGTGLGLAIAKNIVELHGGTCAVRNTKTGVEFKFTV